MLSFLRRKKPLALETITVNGDGFEEAVKLQPALLSDRRMRAQILGWGQAIAILQSNPATGEYLLHDTRIVKLLRKASLDVLKTCPTLAVIELCEFYSDRELLYRAAQEVESSGNAPVCNMLWGLYRCCDYVFGQADGSSSLIEDDLRAAISCFSSIDSASDLYRDAQLMQFRIYFILEDKESAMACLRRIGEGGKAENMWMVAQLARDVCEMSGGASLRGESKADGVRFSING